MLIQHGIENKSMTQLIEITKQIKQKATELGFDACGIAKPDVLEKEYNHLKQWLKENKHGNMAYLEKNTNIKADPRKASIKLNR